MDDDDRTLEQHAYRAHEGYGAEEEAFPQFEMAFEMADEPFDETDDEAPSWWRTQTARILASSANVSTKPSSSGRAMLSGGVSVMTSPSPPLRTR